MPLFPLDAVRNAAIDRENELILEDVREEVARFSFPGFETDDVLEVYDLARPRLNVLLTLLRDPRGRSGVDIGTGFGFLPVLLARIGVVAAATERDLEQASFAAEHGIELRPYVVGRTRPPYPAGSQDFVVLAEVLEHLKIPPVVVLRELTTLLREGGRLLLSTPNVARLAHIEALAAGENFLEPFPEHLPPGADPTDAIEHVREYSVRETVEAVEAAGLVVGRVLMSGWGAAGYEPLANPFVNEICIVEATLDSD